MLQQFSTKRNRFLQPESNEIEFNGLDNRLDKVCGMTYPGTWSRRVALSPFF
jgi:hypothetical protein